MNPSSPLSGKTILVTGARGFMGTSLCRRMKSMGCEIHAVSRTHPSGRKNDMYWWQADPVNIVEIRTVLKTVRPDVIFHLSGLVTGIPSQELVWPTFESLLMSTISLLVSTTEIECRRIILVGSMTEPNPSFSDAVPTSPYAAAKLAASNYGRMFHALYGSPVVIVRAFMGYGPGQDESKLIPSAILALLRGEIPKFSSGRWQADWIYIDDLIEGLLAASHRPNIEGCTIDLGTGKLVSVRRVVQQIINATGRRVDPQFGILPDRPMEQVRVADTTEAYSKLGWKSTTSLENGLIRTVEWYAAQLRVGITAG